MAVAKEEALANIIDEMTERCTVSIMEAAERQLKEYFWMMVDDMQENVLLNSKTKILRENTEVKAILEEMIHGFREVRLGYMYMDSLQARFADDFKRLKIMVYRLYCRDE